MHWTRERLKARDRMTSGWYRWEGEDAVVEVRVAPRARRAAVAVEENRLKVWITAPPVDGRANVEVQKTLAQLFGVARTSVVLIRGARNRSKHFRILGPTRIPEIK